MACSEENTYKDILRKTKFDQEFPYGIGNLVLQFQPKEGKYLKLSAVFGTQGKKWKERERFKKIISIVWGF